MGRESARDRYLVLLCTCLLTFGSYFCFDMPSVLQEEIEQEIIKPWAGDDASTVYNLFYTVYAWTNMVMSLFAGVLTDRLGTQKCAFIFLGFCLLGSSIYALGPALTGHISPKMQFIVMFVGRFVFGLGGGSITIVQNTITAKWFAGKELAMAFGCTLTVSRIGSVVNFNFTTFVMKSFTKMFGSTLDMCKPASASANTSAPIAAPVNGTTFAPSHVPSMTVESDHDCSYALSATFFVGAALVALSFFAAAFFVLLERKADREQRELEDAASENPFDSFSGSPAPSKRKKVQLKDVKDLPGVYWLVCLIITLFYNCIFPFLADAKKFFTDDWHVSDDHAGSISSLVYLVSMIISPFLGRAVDYFGRRGQLATVGCLLTVPTFLMLTPWTGWAPIGIPGNCHGADQSGCEGWHTIVPMLVLGFCYCTIAATAWPSIPLLVPQHAVGTANGVATSMQMLGIGICNILVGFMQDHAKKNHDVSQFKSVMLFFTGMSCVATVLAISVTLLDWSDKKAMHIGQRDKAVKYVAVPTEEPDANANEEPEFPTVRIAPREFPAD